jgi:hypothetical protein
MKMHNKRWLISRMKTAGSRRRHLLNGSFSEDDRAASKRGDPDTMPQRESIRSTRPFYNGKINYGLLVRFLRSQAGNDWDQAYSEIIARIPSKLLDYKEMVYWFVADKVEIMDGQIWNKKTQKFIWTTGVYDFSKQRIEFYVDPETNRLVRIKDVPRKDNATRKRWDAATGQYVKI